MYPTLKIIIYVDFECDDSNNIIEFAAIHVSNQHVQNILHQFCNSDSDNPFAYTSCAMHSHCITKNTLFSKTIPFQNLQTEFKTFIEFIKSPVAIKRPRKWYDQKGVGEIFSFSRWNGYRIQTSQPPRLVHSKRRILSPVCSLHETLLSNFTVQRKKPRDGLHSELL